MRTPLASIFASVGVVAASLAMAASASAGTTATATTTLAATAVPAATTTPSVGAVPGYTKMNFEINLALSNPAGAAALAKSVSEPGSANYRQYLTPAQWEGQFSPTGASVAKVTSFLSSKGFTVTNVSADRMTIAVTGRAAKVQKVFGTTLSYHQVAGKKVILNSTALSVPTTVAPLIIGVSGISQIISAPDDTTGQPSTPATATANVAPPAGFRNAKPCSAYFGEQLAAAFPTLPGGYPNDPSYAPCGYTPPQLRTSYGLTDGNTGSGVTVAIIDAYVSPTLYSDASQYASINDPGNPLKASQFSEVDASSFNDATACAGEAGWYGEQTLDVEAVHATAPGANILFAGAENCEGGLNAMLQTIIDGHLADVVSNSYGDTGGDLTDPASDRAATDDLLEMAAGTGISVLYSSGDDGDNYDQIGTAAPDYPASSPYATAVGGTSLEVGSAGQQLAQYGWSTGKALFCNNDLVAVGACTKAQLETWLPLGYDYGGGGGTSYDYIQPFYQAGVVPTSLSEVHSSTPMRVIPDVSMDADPSTGMLIGETQTFPNGVYYDQYRIGGTSLASPLMAGTVARADQAAGSSAGFLNPALYSLAGNANAINDITTPSSPQDVVRSDYLDDVDTADGILYSARTLDFAGPESFCPVPTKPKKCTTAPLSLATSPGYDNMTGIGAPGAGFVAGLAH